jgi:hypothetical protein
MITFLFPSSFSPFLNNQTRLMLDVSTFPAFYSCLSQSFPEVKSRIFDSAGVPYRFVKFFLNGSLVDIPDFSVISIPPDSTVRIITAVAGG